MNQSKFSLADVITLLTGLAFGFVCFLGANFYTMGDISQSIIFSIVVAVLLIGTAFGAKVLKRTTHNFKAFFILEVGLLIIFIGLMFFFSYSAFAHYFVVSEKKLDIQNKLSTSITQAENMYVDYELYVEKRKAEYLINLKSAVRTKEKGIGVKDYKKFGFIESIVSDQKQISKKMTTIEFDLFPSNFKAKKAADSTWLSNSRKSVVEWKPIGLVDVIKNVEVNSNNCKSYLAELSQVREKGEETSDFQYRLSFKDAKSQLIKTGEPTSFSIGLSSLGCILMLLPYLLTSRSSKSNYGFRSLFSSKKRESSEFDIEL